MNNLENTINKAFDNKETINQETKGEIREAVDETFNILDKGGFYQNIRLLQFS